MAEQDRGVPPERLEDGQLLKELEAIHRTRHETLLYGSDDALETHTSRMGALEAEYLRRHPGAPRCGAGPGRARGPGRVATPEAGSPGSAP
ncbi:hypothetical protein EBF04_08300 [Streptomyces sp. I6]|nr:hypothetical protein EBF04_08300 [Streptomyces sp. I6]